MFRPRGGDDPWNEGPRNTSAISVMCAIYCAICAGQALRAREQAPRNAALTGIRLAAAPRSGHLPARRGVASRRWVMSTTTLVSPVSSVPERLADQAKALLSVVGLSRPAQ